jgi:hypothetical protein
MKSKESKKKSRFGKGLMAGALFGIAAGIFMSSKEGKQIAAKVRRHAAEIEARLKREFKKKKVLGRKAYEDSIDEVLAYYARSKKIAKSEIPDLRRYLIGKWDLIKDEMADVHEQRKAKHVSRPAAKKRKRRA